ncbi:MAG: trigger factor, partial [Phycisphaerales bacterium]
AMRSQAKEQLVAAAFQQAVQDHKLKIVGNPVAKDLDKVEVSPDKAMTFELEIETIPEFEMPSLEGIEIRKPIMAVGEDLVKAEIDKLAIQEGRLEERQVPEAGDYLTGHAKLTGGSDNKVYFESDGIVVQVPAADKNGKGMIVGLVVDDLSKQLGLPKPGDKKVIKTKGPENHENEALRGLELTVEYVPSRVDRIIPATTDELVARFGMADTAALESTMKGRMEQRMGIEQATVMRQQLASHFMQNVKMDLPQRLSAAQAQRTLERRRMDLMHRGVDPQKIEEHIAELRAASANEALGELKLFFIMDRAADQLQVKVSDTEVNGRIAQMAMERNMRPDQLRTQLIQTNQVASVFGQIREHKTMDAILAKAKVTDMPGDEFNKWAKEHNEAGRTASKSKAKDKDEARAESKSESKAEAKAEAKAEKEPAKKKK